MLLKSMLDKVIINHKEKTITVYDLKCTWSVENFYKEYYLYRRSYIQAFLYYRAMYDLTREGQVYEGYKVLNPKFIVCDSINYYTPLIYELSDADMKDAYFGFTYQDRRYPGVKEIINELQWALEHDIWTISVPAYSGNC